ncbi:unnamed protein product [Rhizopus stolonifer]
MISLFCFFYFCVIMHFNHQSINTFLCHWPDFHTFVFVRILDRTVALYPTTSPLAASYFSPPPTKKKWFRKPKPIHVSFEDVLQAHNLSTGWIHAPCRLGPSKGPQEILLLTPDCRIHLLTRSPAQRTCLVNLFWFSRHEPTTTTQHHQHTVQEYLEKSKQRRQDQITQSLKTIDALQQRIRNAQDIISKTTHKLTELNQKEIHLVSESDFEARLHKVNISMVKTSFWFEQCKQRLELVKGRMARYGSCLDNTQDKYTLVEEGGIMCG